MFDQVVVRPRRRALTTILVAGSAVAHAAGLAVLAWLAVWQVEKVALGPDRPITIYQPKERAGASLPPAGKLEPVKVDKPARIKVKTPVQPVLAPPDPAITTAPSGPSTGEPGAGSAGPGGDGPPGPSDAPPCTVPPCSADGEPVAPEPVIRKPPVDEPPPILPPDVARGLRVAGTEQVFPARDTQLAIMRAGKTEVRGTFQLCVDRGGTVSSVRTLRGTGFDDYDGALVSAMRGWRYRPHLVGGQPAPMCTVQVFVYRIRN